MGANRKKIKAVAFIGVLTALIIGLYGLGQATFAAVGPTTALTIVPLSPDGFGGWYKTNPSFSLSADVSSAVTYYSWDNDSFSTYTAPFHIPSGEHTLHYFSKVGTDSIESVNSRVFRRDSKKPTLNVRAPKSRQYVKGIVRIRVNAKDPSMGDGVSSGLKEARVYVGRRIMAKAKAGKKTVRLKTKKVKPGRRLLRVVAKDKAGNVTRFHRTFFVDNNRPKLPIAYFSPSVPVVGEPARLTFRARDRTSPTIKVKVQIRNANGRLLSEAALGWLKRGRRHSVNLKMPSSEGTYIRRIIMIDRAGNRRVKDSAFRVGNRWRLANVKTHVYELSKNIGVRVEGTDSEHRAADYIEERLEAYGYDVERQSFSLPDGKVSYNIVARKTGSEPAQQFVVGAHYDSKSPSPGANDNGTGTGVVLELARLLKTKKLKPTVVFVLFGAEESFGATRYPEHLGSHRFVETMSAGTRANTVGMVSVDMVGIGSIFSVRSLNRGPMSLVNDLLAFAQADGTAIRYIKDFGASDHDQFELAGIPSAWLEWRTDHQFHTTADTYERIQWDAVDITGGYLSRFLIEKFKQ